MSVDGKRTATPTGAGRAPSAQAAGGRRLGWPRGWLRRTPVLAALFVLLATGAVAVASYGATPPVYVASQTLAVVATLPDSSTSASSYEQNLRAQQASQVAQLLTAPAFLASTAVENDVVGRLQSLPGDATTRAATAKQVGAALSASTSGTDGTGNLDGAQVTLTARWSTGAGAQAALAAATAALQYDATQLVQAMVVASGPAATTAAPGATATPNTTSAAMLTPPLAPGELIGAQVVSAPTAATRDGATVAAARTRVYEQLALALLTSLLLGGALQWALTRRR